MSRFVFFFWQDMLLASALLNRIHIKCYRESQAWQWGGKSVYRSICINSTGRNLTVVFAFSIHNNISTNKTFLRKCFIGLSLALSQPDCIHHTAYETELILLGHFSFIHLKGKWKWTISICVLFIWHKYGKLILKRGTKAGWMIYLLLSSLKWDSISGMFVRHAGLTYKTTANTHNSVGMFRTVLVLPGGLESRHPSGNLINISLFLSNRSFFIIRDTQQK